MANYDLIVIGGGINGAAIARDASLRKLKVVLLEKEDFGSGASTNTSKLAHGGIRYLEQFRFGLVKESLRERSLLLKNAPHLVRPLPFLLPVYAKDPHSLWKIDLGLYLYDFLSGSSDFPKHGKLDSQGVLEVIPGLKKQGLLGGCSYYDAQMLDNRLLIETVLSAEQAGAEVYNYREAVDLIREDGQIKGVAYVNSLTGEKGKYYGKAVVNATGAWSNNVGRMEPNAVHCIPAPTKGVHLIVPKMSSATAILLRTPQDGRVFFVMPWGDYHLIGTTDTFYRGDPDDLAVTVEDRAYLLEAFNVFFPEQPLTHSDIISSFAGLRPLVAPAKDKEASDIDREHVVQVSDGGLITVLGGKFTTHRLIAENVVDVVMKRLGISSPCVTQNALLPGAAGPYSFSEVKEKLKNSGLDASLIKHFLSTYGTRSLDVLAIMQNDPKESEVLGNIPLFPALGDREIVIKGSAKSFINEFKLQGAEIFDDELFYTVSAGDAFFAVIATDELVDGHKKVEESFTEPMLRWLDSVLKEGAKNHKYLFVVGYEPAFPSTTTFSIKRQPQRDAFWKILASNKVLAYFSSKEHLFDRSNRYGVWQIISGGGGAPLSQGGGTLPFYHTLVLTIPGNQENVETEKKPKGPSVQVIDNKGNIVEEFTLGQDNQPLYQMRIS